MKFFRTSASVMVVAAFSVASALAAMAPRPPAAAAAASSSPTGGLCAASTVKKAVFPVVMCTERQNSTSANVGNIYPWTSSLGFFATFRNQYMWPSDSAVTKMLGATDTLESMHARTVSFSAAANQSYNNAGKGSSIKIMVSATGTLNRTFALNTTPTILAQQNATATTPINLATVLVTGPGQLSSCVSCVGDADPKSASSRDRWAGIGDISTFVSTYPGQGLMIDSLNNVGGGSGFGVWDTGSGTACEGRRAYGSGAFANVNHLTTALGVDAFDMIWVGQGLAPPPAATVEQQIAEIIRLLLTPEGLRCSGLDLTPGNKKIQDNPIAFPAGSTIDPMSPQVTTLGIISGDEAQDGRRSAGYNHP